MIITMSGRSGVGKTSIIKRLLRRLPGSRMLLSWTTRPMRASDHPGEYEHVIRDVFDRKDADGDFLWTVELAGERYGTSRSDVTRATEQPSRLYVAAMTHDKVMYLHELCTAEGIQNRLLSFYLLAPPPAILGMRMRRRGDSENSIERRMEIDADWDMQAQQSGHPFIFIPDIDADIENKITRIRSYLEPIAEEYLTTTLSENPPP